jgi:hypothetical protein
MSLDGQTSSLILSLSSFSTFSSLFLSFLSHIGLPFPLYLECLFSTKQFILCPHKNWSMQGMKSTPFPAFRTPSVFVRSLHSFFFFLLPHDPSPRFSSSLSPLSSLPSPCLFFIVFSCRTVNQRDQKVSSKSHSLS